LKEVERRGGVGLERNKHKTQRETNMADSPDVSNQGTKNRKGTENVSPNQPPWSRLGGTIAGKGKKRQSSQSKLLCKVKEILMLKDKVWMGHHNNTLVKRESSGGR